jgi:hypothetical protein
LIRIFNNKFILERYYGFEYFTGDLETMKQTIINYIMANCNEPEIKIINEPIIIERVNKITNVPISKDKQELYTKSKVTIRHIR